MKNCPGEWGWSPSRPGFPLPEQGRMSHFERGLPGTFRVWLRGAKRVPRPHAPPPRGELAFTSAKTPARIARGRPAHAATTAARSGSGGVVGVGLGSESPESAPLFAPLLAAPVGIALFSGGVRALYRPLSLWFSLTRPVAPPPPHPHHFLRYTSGTKSRSLASRTARSIWNCITSEGTGAW